MNNIQVCNSNFFIKLSHSTMNALAISQQTPKYAPPPPCYEMDEATGFSSEEEYFDECTRPPISYTRKWELCELNSFTFYFKFILYALLELVWHIFKIWFCGIGFVRMNLFNINYVLPFCIVTFYCNFDRCRREHRHGPVFDKKWC